MSERVAVYWVTKDPSVVARIRDRFGIPRYTNIAGESPAEVSDEDMPLLLETERRGHIAVRRKKWRKNGGLYIFLSR